MIKDTLFKTLSIPILGVLIPVFSKLIRYTRLSWMEIIISNMIFVTTSYIIWQGSVKIISRIIRPTQGTVRGNGKVSSLLEVGTGFNNELTGRENIYLSGYLLGMSRDEIKRKFDEIVDFSGIERFLDTPVKRYSSGMYVRLAFAVAAHLEPDILIVDEVLAVGDA